MHQFSSSRKINLKVKKNIRKLKVKSQCAKHKNPGIEELTAVFDNDCKKYIKI